MLRVTASCIAAMRRHQEAQRRHQEAQRRKPCAVAKLESKKVMATPSQIEQRVFQQWLRCWSCGYTDSADTFIDGRNFTICANDTYDCPCCGKTTVAEDYRRTREHNDF